MHSSLFLCGFLLVAYAFHSEGVVLSKCDQVKALRKSGVPKWQFQDWLCIIEHESHGNTQAKNTNNVDGSWDWGIFQINDRYWCGRNGVGGGCHLPCSALFDNNISNDIKCAQQIYKESKGFGAWVAWRNYCQGGKPPVPNC